jgi:hypothetical protein
MTTTTSGPRTQSRAQRKATGRAYGSGGDLIRIAGAQACLPVQTLAVVTARLRPAQHNTFRITEGPTALTGDLADIAAQIPDGPWETQLQISSWFIPGSGMHSDTAITVAAARAMTAAAEAAGADDLVHRLTAKVTDSGLGLSTPGITVTDGTRTIFHTPWVPALSVVTVIPVDKDRNPLRQQPSAPAGGDPNALIDALNARDTGAVVAVAEDTARRSDHPALPVLDRGLAALRDAGINPLGRITDGSGPSAGLLFPNSPAGRADASRAAHTLATALEGLIRVTCVRTARTAE